MDDWNEVTAKLLNLLPNPNQADAFNAAEPVSRHTWELASQIKDGLVGSNAQVPSAVYGTTDARIIFEFELSEQVLVVCSVCSSEIVVTLIQMAGRVLKTVFEAPFQLLERLTKGIAVWLSNLLRSNCSSAPTGISTGT